MSVSEGSFAPDRRPGRVRRWEAWAGNSESIFWTSCAFLSTEVIDDRITGRLSNGSSRLAFAAMLGIAKSLVGSWETGGKGVGVSIPLNLTTGGVCSVAASIWEELELRFLRFLLGVEWI